MIWFVDSSKVGKRSVEADSGVRSGLDLESRNGVDWESTMIMVDMLSA